MSEESNIEDVAQSETTEANFEGYGIGDADTAEGQARRAEEAHLKEMMEDLHKKAEELPELPTEEEAEMGELCKSTEGEI